jgi:hypothetical protein
MIFHDLNPKLGRSGARFIATSDQVLKIDFTYDPQRVTAQGSYMKALRDVSIIPRVFAVGAGWYAMERLSHRYDVSLWTVLDALRTQLWDRPEKSLFALPRDNEWVQPVLERVAGVDVELAIKISSRLSPEHAVHVLLHGDPTRENVMRRSYENKEFVLTDALPPMPHNPPIRASDIGKLLQCVAGWTQNEFRDAYLGHSHTWDTSLEEVIPCLVRLFGAGETQLALTFCAYHLLRAVPYATNGSRLREIARRVLELEVGTP